MFTASSHFLTALKYSLQNFLHKSALALASHTQINSALLKSTF
jgi:hypothetical protein